MKVIWLTVWCCSAALYGSSAVSEPGSEAQALESRAAQFPAIEGRHGVDPNPIEPMRARLVNGIVGCATICNEILVAEARQTIFLVSDDSPAGSRWALPEYA